MSSDPSRLMAALARDRIDLELKTVDLCFLATRYLRPDRTGLGEVYIPERASLNGLAFEGKVRALARQDL